MEFPIPHDDLSGLAKIIGVGVPHLRIRGTVVADTAAEAREFGEDFMRLGWAISEGINEHNAD